MLTPERIPFIVFTVPPLLLLIVIFFARPVARRLLGAFVGGLAFAVLHISRDTVAHSAGWWRSRRNWNAGRRGCRTRDFCCYRLLRV